MERLTMATLAQSQQRTQSSHLFHPARTVGLNPHNAPAEHALVAQQPTWGNQAMQHLLNARMIQAKLTINQPGDPYEQEADRVAEQVMRMPDPRIMGRAVVTGRSQGVSVQRMCPQCEEELHRQPQVPDIQRMCPACEEKLHRQPMEEEEEEETLQTKEIPGRNPEVTSDMQAQVNALGGGGQPLPQTVRAFFEPRFGYDFSQVRVHTDAASRETAQALNARAFTAGRDIFFNDQEFQPATHTGRRLLAHELAHTVQQAASRFPDRQPIVQRTIGDGHDLANPRFSGELRLEAAFDNERVLAVGSCGDHVRIIQEALMDLGVALPIFGADCQFGSETRKAVVSFQTQNNAVIDGVVGFETMGLLDTLAPSGRPPAIECPPCPSKKPDPEPEPDPDPDSDPDPDPHPCDLPGKCFPEIPPGVFAQCGRDPTTGSPFDCREIPGERCGVCENPGGKQGKCRDDAKAQQDKEVAKCSAEEDQAISECIADMAECVASGGTNAVACAEAANCAVGGPHFERVECEKEAFKKFREAQKECDKIPD
jgi:hypothetical protein